VDLKPSGNGSHLIVAVTDAGGLPIADATVEISGPSGTFNSQTSVGSISQTDWSGGAGQTNYIDQTRFASTDGGIDYSSAPGQLKLASAGLDYLSSGELISSTIDFGNPSTFQQLSWIPSTQISGLGLTPVRFQIATNIASDATDWNFVGPDGTSGSYYTSSPSDISSVHDGGQYLRYKLLLSSSDQNKTPSISDIAITYTSGCLPPGQADFGGLSSGDYTITISKTGYTTVVKTITISSDDYENIQINP
jgi:hypothetical protein